MRHRAFPAISLACLFILGELLFAGCSRTAAPPTSTVAKYAVFETSLLCDDKMNNPFVDATMTAEFTSPSGAKVNALGFYFGGNEWRVRFVPREHGTWAWSAALVTPTGKRSARGAFECKGTEGHGFLKPAKRNPYRMEYDDGTPFYPIGIQTCDFLRPDFDGSDEVGSWRSVSAEEWVKAFEGSVNLVRTQLGQGTTNGCALPLISAGNRKNNIPPGPIDRYDTDLAAKMDDVYRLQRAHGFSQILILFQDMSLWGSGRCIFGGGRDLERYKSVKAANLPDQERYVRYAVARFGCYVDIWELFNEDSYAPNDYLARLATVVREADPHAHIITTNYARPAEPWCEIVTWHEYMGMPANAVDAYLASQIALYKSYGKVVQNTEFGNGGSLGNVDPVKWRIAVWTAFMNESGMLFWGASGRKVGPKGPNMPGNSNAYIGPDTRRHFRVLNDFNRDMPLDMKPVPTGYTRHDQIRTYGLSNGRVTAVYVHHFADHAQPYQLPQKLFVETGPGKFRARWIDPEDGRELRVDEVTTRQQFLEVPLPPVTIDAACRIDRLGAEAP